MKRSFIFIVALVGFFSMIQQSHADDDIGLGIVGEDPTGLTLKLELTEAQALDFRLGLGFRFADAFLFQGNYLVDVVDIANNDEFELPLYIGVGSTLFINKGNNVAVNARVPIGMELELHKAPIDLFAEVAPQLTITPLVAIGVDGALGVRFFF